METTQVVKQPLITEKATWEAERHNRYAFQVDRRANKPQIARAVQRLYNVRVRRVRTQNRKGRNLRNRFGIGRTSNWKKAVVELHPEDRIEVM